MVLKHSITKRSVVRVRDGATAVEMAIVLPVFLTFVFALIEFGHAYMVSNMLTAAAKIGARAGVGGSLTNEEITERSMAVLAAAIKTTNVTVSIRDGSAFDEGSNNIDTSTLPNIVVKDADPRTVFVVRMEVNYDDVCLMPPMWNSGVLLIGQSVMRRE